MNVAESPKRPSPLTIFVQVGQVTIPFLVDTGATVSLINKQDFQFYFPGTRLLQSHVVLQNYSKTCITNVGYFTATVRYNNTTAPVTFYVTTEGSSLLGLDAIKDLCVNIHGATLSCSQVSTTAASSIPSNAPSEFQHLFTQDLGLVKGYRHEVKRRPGIPPVATKLRRLPLLLREQVAHELSRLERSGVIERVSASDWVSPLVVVKKKNGSLRLCVDLREPNKAIVIDGFPLPHIEELLEQLTGAKYFSKLDLASAYHQVELSESSRDLTTFITHDGLFRFRRVCFGLASAPAVFQKMMSDILKGCSGVLCYLDDILVWGKTRQEHDANLHAVLSRISNSGMKLNDKCVFAVQEIQFLGHSVNTRGLSPLESKVHAIVNAPTPTDSKSLQSFLGLAGYYSKFIPHYADVVEPLRAMLRKGQTFNWSQEANSSFNAIKELLAANPVVQIFDEQLPIVITTDASNIGLGAVFQQRQGDQLITIAFASRTLSPAERRYSAGEREALACLFACEKWHVYLWGRHFTLRTGHQALTTLLSAGSEGRRPLRISRWCARLLYYNFTVEYCKGSNNVIADALSRLPLQLPTSPELDEEIISLVTPCISKADLQAATADDATLQQVIPYIANGWPEKKSLPPDLLPYFAVRHELSYVDNLLFRADRLSIPASLCNKLVQLAHESHPGIVRTKQRLRERYWWPGLDKQVEHAIHNCVVCQAADKSAKPVFAPLQPVPWPTNPWEKLGIDIVGPLEHAPYDCRFAITLIDYHSKWPEVCFTNTVTSDAIITFLSALFSREGFPEAIVTDNGPQFKSNSFETFLSDRGIQHLCSSNYYPQANGQVERFNRVLKEQIQLAQLEHRPLKEAITEYLGTYRFTPQATTGVSPAQLLHKRQPRSAIDITGLHPKSSAPSPALDPVRTRVFHRQQATKQRVDTQRGAKPPTKLQVGLRVKVRFPGKQTKYKGPFTIRSQVGPYSFRLSDGNVWNASKLVPVSAEPDTPAPRNSGPTLPTPSSDNEQPLMQPKLIRLPMWHFQTHSPQPAVVPSPGAAAAPSSPGGGNRVHEQVHEPPQAPSVSNSSPIVSVPRPKRPRRRRKRPARFKDYVT